MIHPATGAVIGGFTLGERIHSGPMSSLWSVTRDRPDDPPLLMKIPALRDGDDVSAIIGFEVEQMIMPRLTGPHVPTFVAAGDFSQTPFLVMERVVGEGLAARTRAGPIPPAEVARLGQAMARALQSLHRQHVAHLDIKPANIMLRPDGAAVFLDFGLSRHDELPDLLGEESDVPMGTGAYIAPEQVLGDRTEPRSDLFALGCVLYELVTGALPFGNPQRKSGMMTRLWKDPVPPRARVPDCPAALQEVILRCLAPDPAKRPASPAQLAFLLQHPDQVTLSPAAERVSPDSSWTVFRRWLKAGKAAPRLKPTMAAQLAKAPIVVAAVDLADPETPLADLIRTHVSRVLAAEPGARLACLTVMKTALIALDSSVDKEGNHLYVQRLIALKDWVRPLAIPEDRVSFHVLEALDPAAALIEYARHNDVDHIVVGARGASALRRYLGSVSAQVVAEAPCTVTVVRLHAPAPPA